MSEDEIFENMEESEYLTGLNGVITTIRQSRQPYSEIVVLLAGESDSEALVQSICICD